MKPLVSILIPCFNAELLVAQAIESALAQTGPDFEVIVVDNGSAPEVEEWLHDARGLEGSSALCPPRAG